MVPFIVYQMQASEVEDSAIITRAGVCSPEQVSIQAAGDEFADDKRADPDLHFVVVDEFGEANIRDRLAMPTTINKTDILANGTDAAVISVIPADPLVTVDTVPQVVVGTTFSFTAAVAGTYVIKVSAFPYLTQTYTVTAT